MYYYAYIDVDTGFCHDVIESEELLDDPSYVEVGGFSSYIDYLKYYPVRKTYENGTWRDTTIDEAERMFAVVVGERATINGEWLSIVLDNKANIDHTHDGYADVSHSHDEYATQVAIDALSEEVDGKANVNHSHSEYATMTEVSALGDEINEKANAVHTHTGYAPISHNHNEDYSPLSHSHTEYAPTSHTHDDRYCTETEINTKLSAKSDSTHNHNTSYDTKGSANNSLVSAKAYADGLIEDEVANRDTAIATAKSSAISTASSDATTKANNALASAKTYTDTAVATAKNDLLNGAGTAYDTLKELGDLINDNVDAIEALEAVAAGKANASHTHTIANITNLQSTLDGKAAASHGTHVTYSTTAPVMDGTASVGTAATVARSDHKHPTDTSRAAQTSLDSHTSNKSNPHGVTLAQLGITATAAELNKMDGVTATTAELNYVDGVTSNIQTQLNGKAASGHTHSAATTSANGLMSTTDKSKLDGMVLATVSEVETYLGI